MNGNVKSHELPELWVSESKLVGVVRSIVESTVSCGDVLVVAIFVCIYKSSDTVNLSTEIEAVLVGCFPVLGFVDTRVVSLHKVRSWLASEDTS